MRHLLECRVRVGEKHHSDRVTGIQVKYGEVWGDLHGKGDGNEFEAVLAEGDQLWSVQGLLWSALFGNKVAVAQADVAQTAVAQVRISQKIDIKTSLPNRFVSLYAPIF